MILNISDNNIDDQLMVFCWTGMLPLAIALVVLVPSILVAFDVTPY